MYETSRRRIREWREIQKMAKSHFCSCLAPPGGIVSEDWTDFIFAFDSRQKVLTSSINRSELQLKFFEKFSLEYASERKNAMFGAT